MGGQHYGILFVVFPLPVVSWKRSRNLKTAAQLRPGTEGFWDPAGACCALRTPRETAGRDHVSGRGGGEADAPPRRGPALPARRRPPLAGGCELRLVKPSPGIYRSLERNEVAFGEGGREGGLDSHRGQCTAAAAPSFSHPGRSAREEAAAAAGASTGGGRASSRGEADRQERAAGATHPHTCTPTPEPCTPET